ncbi:MAG TPA: hypothetical protein VGY56_17995 [Verrucomicrobiae bacterium]|nr:hypothetical protein [Verrucomicrobiae bacterium]
MKKLLTFAIAILLGAASLQARANSIIAPQTVSFVGVSDGVVQSNNCHTSDIAPGYADFTANDDDMAWTSPALLPAPVPEPSAFALLVASAFAFCLLKDRLKNIH